MISDPAFGSYGRLIFPVDSWYYSGDTLGDLQLTWYNNIDPAKTVEIVNYLKEHAEAGDTVFYDIYTEEEKAADPEKEDTGLFFFKGEPGEKFAVCNAGGGFAYVGAMQDSFPHALELSKRGYNAFACVGESDGIASWRTMQRRLETLESMGIPTEFHHYPGLRTDSGLEPALWRKDGWTRRWSSGKRRCESRSASGMAAPDGRSITTKEGSIL